MADVGRRRILTIAVTMAATALLAVSCSANTGQRDGTITSEAPDAPGILTQADAGYSGDGERNSVAPAAGAATGGASDIAESSADLLGRKVIRTGTLELNVDSVADSYDRVSAIASDLGGYVAESSFTGTADARSARVVMRVPADRYDEALAGLRGLAVEVRSITSNAQDMTGEVTDIEAALRNLRAVEAQYVELLSRAQAIPDILQVQERLHTVRADIERTEARLALLTRLTDLATITVQLAPVPAVPAQAGSRSPIDAAGEAWEASLESIRQVAVVGVSVLVYSWWLVPLLTLALLGARKLLRARRGAAGVSSA